MNGFSSMAFLGVGLLGDIPACTGRFHGRFGSGFLGSGVDKTIPLWLLEQVLWSFFCLSAPNHVL